MPIRMSRDVAAVLGEKASGCANLSLLTDKFADLPEDKPDGKKDTVTRTRFVQEMVKRRHAGGEQYHTPYRTAWWKTLPSSRFVGFEAVLKGRLIVNQAGGVVENAGLCLDRHFSIPYIAGSALKGVARNAALEAVSEDQAHISSLLAVFGWGRKDPHLESSGAEAPSVNSSFEGCVSFLPAYPLGEWRLTEDIVTCHHPKYYQNSASEVGYLDTEAPIPNPFPAVEAGCRFTFGIALGATPQRMRTLRRLAAIPEDFDPLGKAQQWLIRALTDHGVGAKTCAGYGWFAFDVKAEEERREAGEKAQKLQEERRQKQKAEAKRLASLSPMERAREEIRELSDEDFSHFVKDLDNKSTEQQRAVLQILRAEKRNKLKVWKKRKPSRFESIREIAEKLGEELP